MTRTLLLLFGICLAAGTGVSAQTSTPAATSTFDDVAASSQKQLEDSIAELATLRQAIADEMVPLSRRLSELEAELIQARQAYQQTSRVLDTRTLDISRLQDDLKKRQDEAGYLSNLLGEYIRNFESRLHIAELQRYKMPLEAAKLAAENTTLSQKQVNDAQTSLLNVSLDRLYDLLNGARFSGSAIDNGGLVRNGTFVSVGPAVVFRSEDGQVTGAAGQRLGSLEPAVTPFEMPQAEAAAVELVSLGAGSTGRLPLDPTLGEAHKIAAINESLWEHIQKGGPVMVPIFILAGAALLVALYKWITITMVRKPSRQRLAKVLEAASRGDKEAAASEVRIMRGPTGKMLRAAVEHLDEPRELIEEVMFEIVLATRLRLQRFLPFVAISAAAAPLLGLLGTVTGIMNTFSLITVFGTGDVKTLSSGISEALITTEYGLIVAIPSLLLHALLSRKARAVVDRMEQAAIAFMNHVGPGSAAMNGPASSPRGPLAAADKAPSASLSVAQVQAAITEALAILVSEKSPPKSMSPKSVAHEPEAPAV